MSAAAFASALRAEGLTVRERSGWATHNRAGHGPWGPLNGVMIHHTASADGASIDDLCWAGRPDLAGPLCHGVIHKDGSVTLVGWGRANHAGLGDARVLAAVVAESTAHPRPGAGTIDGNPHFVGFECVNRGDGHDPWPNVQLDAIARAATAVCRHYGWTEQSVIGHLDWTNQKTDPRGFAMSALRAQVAARLAHPADWDPLEDDMELTDRVRLGDWVLARWPGDKGVGDQEISVATALASGYAHARAAHDTGDAILAKLGALEARGLTGEQIDAIATAVAAHPGLVDALSDAIADKLASRLQP